MREIKYSFGTRRNLNYIKTNLYIMWKSFLEYKINTYMIILDTLFWFVFQYILINIISSEFGTIINWSKNDFIIFIIFVNLIWVPIGIFQWGRVLFNVIREGELNTLLSKPLGIKLKTYFSNFDGGSIIYFILVLFYSIFLIMMFDVEFHNKFFGIILTLIIGLIMVLFFLAIDS